MKLSKKKNYNFSSNKSLKKNKSYNLEGGDGNTTKIFELTGEKLGITLKQNQDTPEIKSVTPDGISDAGGLKVDDIITEVNGKTVTTKAAAITAITEAQQNKKFKLVIQRSNQGQTKGDESPSTPTSTTPESVVKDKPKLNQNPVNEINISIQDGETIDAVVQKLQANINQKIKIRVKNQVTTGGGLQYGGNDTYTIVLDFLDPNDASSDPGILQDAIQSTNEAIISDPSISNNDIDNLKKNFILGLLNISKIIKSFKNDNLLTNEKQFNEIFKKNYLYETTNIEEFWKNKNMQTNKIRSDTKYIKNAIKIMQLSYLLPINPFLDPKIYTKNFYKSNEKSLLSIINMDDYKPNTKIINKFFYNTFKDLFLFLGSKDLKYDNFEEGFTEAVIKSYLKYYINFDSQEYNIKTKNSESDRVTYMTGKLNQIFENWSEQNKDVRPEIDKQIKSKFMPLLEKVDKPKTFVEFTYVINLLLSKIVNVEDRKKNKIELITGSKWRSKDFLIEYPLEFDTDKIKDDLDTNKSYATFYDLIKAKNQLPLNIIENKFSSYVNMGIKYLKQTNGDLKTEILNDLNILKLSLIPSGTSPSSSTSSVTISYKNSHELLANEINTSINKNIIKLKGFINNSRSNTQWKPIISIYHEGADQNPNKNYKVLNENLYKIHESNFNNLSGDNINDFLSFLACKNISKENSIDSIKIENLKHLNLEVPYHSDFILKMKSIYLLFNNAKDENWNNYVNSFATFIVKIHIALEKLVFDKQEGLKYGVGDSNTKRFVYNKKFIKQIVFPEILKYLIINYAREISFQEKDENYFMLLDILGPKIDNINIDNQFLDRYLNDDIDIYKPIDYSSGNNKLFMNCGNLKNFSDTSTDRNCQGGNIKSQVCKKYYALLKKQWDDPSNLSENDQKLLNNITQYSNGMIQHDFSSYSPDPNEGYLNKYETISKENQPLIDETSEIISKTFNDIEDRQYSAFFDEFLKTKSTLERSTEDPDKIKTCTKASPKQASSPKKSAKAIRVCNYLGGEMTDKGCNFHNLNKTTKCKAVNLGNWSKNCNRDKHYHPFKPQYYCLNGTCDCDTDPINRKNCCMKDPSSIEKNIEDKKFFILREVTEDNIKKNSILNYLNGILPDDDLDKFRRLINTYYTPKSTLAKTFGKGIDFTWGSFRRALGSRNYEVKGPSISKYELGKGSKAFKRSVKNKGSDAVNSVKSIFGGGITNYKMSDETLRRKKRMNIARFLSDSYYGTEKELEKKYSDYANILKNSKIINKFIYEHDRIGELMNNIFQEFDIEDHINPLASNNKLSYAKDIIDNRLKETFIDSPDIDLKFSSTTDIINKFKNFEYIAPLSQVPKIFLGIKFFPGTNIIANTYGYTNDFKLQFPNDVYGENLIGKKVSKISNLITNMETKDYTQDFENLEKEFNDILAKYRVKSMNNNTYNDLYNEIDGVIQKRITTYINFITDIANLFCEECTKTEGGSCDKQNIKKYKTKLRSSSTNSSLFYSSEGQILKRKKGSSNKNRSFLNIKGRQAVASVQNLFNEGARRTIKGTKELMGSSIEKPYKIKEDIINHIKEKYKNRVRNKLGFHDKDGDFSITISFSSRNDYEGYTSFIDKPLLDKTEYTNEFKKVDFESLSFLYFGYIDEANNTKNNVRRVNKLNNEASKLYIKKVNDWKNKISKIFGQKNFEITGGSDIKSDENKLKEYDSDEYDSDEYDSDEYDSDEYDSDEYDFDEYDSDEYDSDEYDSDLSYENIETTQIGGNDLTIPSKNEMIKIVKDILIKDPNINTFKKLLLKITGIGWEEDNIKVIGFSAFSNLVFKPFFLGTNENDFINYEKQKRHKPIYAHRKIYEKINDSLHAEFFKGEKKLLKYCDLYPVEENELGGYFKKIKPTSDNLSDMFDSCKYDLGDNLEDKTKQFWIIVKRLFEALIVLEKNNNISMDFQYEYIKNWQYADKILRNKDQEVQNISDHPFILGNNIYNLNYAIQHDPKFKKTYGDNYTFTNTSGDFKNPYIPTWGESVGNSDKLDYHVYKDITDIKLLKGDLKERDVNLESYNSKMNEIIVSNNYAEYQKKTIEHYANAFDKFGINLGLNPNNYGINTIYKFCPRSCNTDGLCTETEKNKTDIPLIHPNREFSSYMISLISKIFTDNNLYMAGRNSNLLIQEASLNKDGSTYKTNNNNWKKYNKLLMSDTKVEYEKSLKINEIPAQTSSSIKKTISIQTLKDLKELVGDQLGDEDKIKKEKVLYNSILNDSLDKGSSFVRSIKFIENLFSKIDKHLDAYIDETIKLYGRCSDNTTKGYLGKVPTCNEVDYTQISKMDFINKILDDSNPQAVLTQQFDGSKEDRLTYSGTDIADDNNYNEEFSDYDFEGKLKLDHGIFKNMIDIPIDKQIIQDILKQ